MPKLFTALIEVAIIADSSSEACDAISAGLYGRVLDWQYVRSGPGYSGPVEHGSVSEETYEEGDAFSYGEKHV